MNAPLEDRIRNLFLDSNDHRTLAAVCDIVLELHNKILTLETELQQIKQHHDDRVMALNRRIDRLCGVHGA